MLGSETAGAEKSGLGYRKPTVERFGTLRELMRELRYDPRRRSPRS